MGNVRNRLHLPFKNSINTAGMNKKQKKSCFAVFNLMITLIIFANGNRRVWSEKLVYLGFGL